MRLCECGTWATAIPCVECEIARRAHTRKRSKPRHIAPSSTYRPGWRRAREQALLRDRHMCRLCGSTDRLEVHHKVPMWVEVDRYNVATVTELIARGINPDRSSNLTTLCAACHDDQHRNDRKK